jgi:hypothetical protein
MLPAFLQAASGPWLAAPVFEGPRSVSHSHRHQHSYDRIGKRIGPQEPLMKARQLMGLWEDFSAHHRRFARPRDQLHQAVKDQLRPSPRRFKDELKLVSIS